MKKNTYFNMFILTLIIFIVYTILVKFVDVNVIGLSKTKVGFSHINEYFHNLIWVNFDLYRLTDIVELPALLFVVFFGVLGLIQLIKRKSLKKVDYNIISLGIFYLSVLFVFLLFEVLKINSRPVLIDGKLETSYPSSTTLLSVCVIFTVLDQLDIYVKSDKAKLIIKIFLVLYSVFLVVGRLISGVHWFTDIIGSIIISVSLVLFYYFIKEKIKNTLIRI